MRMRTKVLSLTTGILTLFMLCGVLFWPSRAQSRVMGDINGDGAVDLQDVRLAIQVAAGVHTPTPDERLAGDINGDGVIDFRDGIHIARIAFGLASGPATGADAAIFENQLRMLDEGRRIFR